MTDSKPEVAVIMGSASDWETMKHACDMSDPVSYPHRTLPTNYPDVVSGGRWP